MAGEVSVLRNNLEEEPAQEIKEGQTFLVLLRFREGTKPSTPPLEGSHSTRESLDYVTKSSTVESDMFDTCTSHKHSQGRNL